HEHDRRQQPGDHALGDRADSAYPPPALVVGVGRPEVADDRGELAIADLLLRERRHHERPGAHRLGDLDRRHMLDRRRARAGHESALPGDLMASRAVLGEELLALGDVSGCWIGVWDRLAVAQLRHVRGESADLARIPQPPVGLRLVLGVAERHVAGPQVEVRRQSARGPDGGDHPTQPHPWWHSWRTTAPIPLHTMISRNSGLVVAPTTARKRTRPAGGTSPSGSVARKTRNAEIQPSSAMAAAIAVATIVIP